MLQEKEKTFTAGVEDAASEREMGEKVFNPNRAEEILNFRLF